MLKVLKAAMKRFSISRESVLYTKYYNNISVKEGTLLIDNCKCILQSPQLLNELCSSPDYKDLKKYIVTCDCDEVKVNNDFELVKRHSKKHLKLLAGCKIIISDCIDDFYIRKSEQAFYCFAKGESKSLVQRSCIIATHIVCKNDELDYIRNEYMLDNIFTGTYVLSGGEHIDAHTYCNNKENVFIFTGALEKNGITTALKNLLNSLGDDKNYIPFFYEKSILPNKESINELGGGKYISITGDMNMSLCETLVLGLYYLNIRLIKNTDKILDSIYNREIKRCFGDIRIDYVIHFTGYARNVLQLICRIDAKRFVWVHNNMFLESRTKGNVHIDTVKYGYDKCDKIVVVRDTMKNELESYVEPEQRNKITVVHNINDVKSILSKAEMAVGFDDDTYCNVSIGELNTVLENDNINKFINIARFSQEKGIDRLISAFDSYRKSCDENAFLIIIGGYGEEFDKICKMVSERKNIILIKSIMNPYPILKKCNLFVLSSHYEGLPMTIIEALILDVPVVSTSITGPKEFLSDGFGMLVDDSEQGIIEGMKAYKSNALSSLKKFDVDEFNENAMAEFLSLFK